MGVTNKRGDQTGNRTTQCRNGKSDGSDTNINRFGGLGIDEINNRSGDEIEREEFKVLTYHRGVFPMQQCG